MATNREKALETRMRKLEGEIDKLKGRVFEETEGKAVTVPDAFKAIFEQAQKVVGQYFKKMSFDPTKAMIKVDDQRYILLRASSLSYDFLDAIQHLYRDRGKEALSIGLDFLFDIAHVIGMEDAKNFHKKMGLVDPISKLSAGPVHFAYTGWAFVNILPESRPTPDKNYFIKYHHPYSFEADSWINANRKSERPICIMNAGYSSGWCEESFGIPLTSVEICCRAHGDDNCTFIMAPPEKIKGYMKDVTLVPKKTSFYHVPSFFERKRVEEALKTANDELEERVEKRTNELKKANEQLKQEIEERKQAEKARKDLEEKLIRSKKMEALGILAGGVAHDLNNILTEVVGYSDLILADLKEEQGSLIENLSTIKDASRRAGDVIQDLLTLARRGVKVSKTINLNDIVSKYMRSPLLKGLKKTSPGISINTKLQENLFNINGSPVHLQKSLVNLVSNAVESVPSKNGNVVISTRNQSVKTPIEGYDSIPEGDYVVLCISDNGLGINPNDLGRIFEPFYTTKEMGKSGSGLGLAVVWGTIQDHNGYIDVHTCEKGTTFKLYFPTAMGEKMFKEKNISIVEYYGKGETIVVVDDVEKQRTLLSSLLAKLGYHVKAFSSGSKAIEYMRDYRADLLILDMIMGKEMDGLDTYRKILELCPKQKAIILSGFSETERVKEALKLGAGAYVKKPYTLESIGATIKLELKKT